MAQRTVIHLVDDLDPDTEATRTVAFSLDGTDYLIDLNADHDAALRAALDRYIAAARAAQPAPGAPGSLALPKRVRAWWRTYWRAAQLPQPRRHGPIPTQVYDAYRTAPSGGRS